MSRWSRARRALPGLVVVLVLVGLLALLAVGGASAQTDESAGLEDGETVFVVELDPSGDASWQITERIHLEDDADEAAFSEVADDFEAGVFDLAGVAAIEAAADEVDPLTDRPMGVSDHDRTTAIEGAEGNRTGTLTASFTWENFARMDQDSDNLHIDDVLETDQGIWFSGLTADQQLTIVSPEGYAVLDATVPPRDGELHWEGPAEFDNGTLTATFVGDGINNDTDNDSEPGNGDDNLGLLAVLLGGIFVAALAAFGVLYRDRLRELLDRSSSAGADPADGAAAEDGDGDRADEAGSQAEVEAAETDESARPGTAGATAAAGESDIDEELLSDEERVERLLERNGGRMKQADIVESTGWSNAKVSQLLSAMEEEGRINKLRIGRENLISFPDVDVTDPGNGS